MAVAETARLIASLELQDKLSPGLANAARNVGGLEGRMSTLTTRAGAFGQKLQGSVGGALTTFSGRLKSVATAGLGLLGIGGIFSGFKFLESGLDTARAFGDEVIKMARLTGLSTEATSKLASAFHHYGIESNTALRITGFLEKTIGNLAIKKDGLAKFEKAYGVSLTDTNGKLKDANELTLTLSDFYTNKAIPQTQKIAALTKLFGRGWQEIEPFLAAGRKGIQGVEEEAQRLGLTLNDKNIKALKDSKEATRQWGTALGGLQLQIGLQLLPEITKLANSATAFVKTHGGDIVTFFKNAIAFGKSAAGTIGEFAGAVSSFWSSIPAGVRDLLLKGLIADRTVKFLFGISPIKIVASLAESAISGLLGGVAKSVGGSIIAAGLGKAFIQPVFVTNMGVGGLGGGGGVPGVPAAAGAAATTGISALGKVFLIGEAVGLVASVVAVGQAVKDSALGQAKDIHTVLTDSLSQPNTQAQLQEKLDAIDTGIAKLKADPIAAALITGPTITELEKMRADVVAAMKAGPSKPIPVVDHATERGIEKFKTAFSDHATERGIEKFKVSQTTKLSAVVEKLRETKAAQIAAADRIGAKTAAVSHAVMSAKAAQILASDRTTRAVNAIPPPKTNITIPLNVRLAVTANSVTRSITQSSLYTANHLGALTKAGNLL